MLPFRDNIPARRFPLVTVLIIAANAAVFLYQLTLSETTLQEVVVLHGVVPARVQVLARLPVRAAGSALTSVWTAMFLHAGWVHLIGNMWYLWIFGDNVEDRMGRFRFLLFYLLCGAAGNAAHIAFNLDSSVPSIGASGAVAGVLGAYLLSYPFARILTLLPFLFVWPVIELPALLVLGGWFLLQLLNGATSEGRAGVAWWAHIGGFLAGMALVAVFARRPTRRYTWEERED
jgi:membrane associated rhomboid family serine protease